MKSAIISKYSAESPQRNPARCIRTHFRPAFPGIPERGAFVFYDCLCPSKDGPVNWGHCGISLGDGKVIHAWDVVRIDGYTEIERLTALTGDHPKYLGWVPLDRVLAQKQE
ncbi:MAG: hypothetical protein J5912_02630 [Clostridia bacterium]|nr:hypothetical protein [Clostridia bacterium]